MTNLGPRVDIGVVFGEDVSYASVAAAFHIDAYELLEEICKVSGTNATAFPALYAELRELEPWLTSYATLEARARQYWGRAHGGTDAIVKADMPFLNWTIPKEVEIRLPKSASDAVLVSADADTASRYVKLAIECPDFAKLELMCDRIVDLAGELDVCVTELAEKVVPRAQECLVYLSSGKRLLTMMYEAIPPTTKAAVDYNAAANLDVLEGWREMEDEAVRALVTDPSFVSPSLHERIETHTRQLLEEFADPDNIRRLEHALKFYDAAEQVHFWAKLDGALCYSAGVLLRSGHADRFVEDYLIPFFGEFAARADVSALSDRLAGRPLKQAMLDGWRSLVPKKKASLFSTLGKIGSIGAGAIGNSRGPASLAVSLVIAGGRLAGTYLANRSISLNRSGTAATAICLRILMRVAPLSSEPDLNILLDKVVPAGNKTPQLDAIKKIRCSETFMSSAKWTAAYLLLNLAAFTSQLTDDEDWSLRRVAVTLQSLVQTSVPAAELLGAIAKVLDDPKLASRILGAASKIAVAAGIMAAVLAAWTLAEEVAELLEEGGVDLGDILNIVGAGATIATAGAWLALEVLSLSATAAAATATVMAIGSVIAVAVAVATIMYQEATKAPGTATYLRACLETFETTANGDALLHSPDFAKAFKNAEELLDIHETDLVSFAGKKDELYTLYTYFSVEGCATIVEMEPHIVKQILGVD